MSTPNGLRRFARSMRTRYSGTCHFCAAATVPGNDYAAQTGAGWIAVCIPCSESTVAQVRGTYRRIHDMVTSPDVTTEMKAAASVQMPSSDKLAAAMLDDASDTVAFDALVALLSVIPALTPTDPMAANLQALANNPVATPHHRTVAASMLENIGKWGKLTDKQRSYAESLIAQYANGATPADKPAAVKVPEGYYAVTVEGWKEPLSFFKVDAPTTGKWAGYTFVKHIIGGHEPIRIKGDSARTILQLIGADIDAAGRRYAAEFTRCYKCNLQLTDEVSRARGLGSTCAGR